jgi:carbonic anhydrase
MKKAIILIATVLMMNMALCAQDRTSVITPEQSLIMMKEGNKRFVEGHRMYPHLDSARIREQAAEGQKPYAAILSCSDSRVPVEHIFDAGIGDLFVLRDAGNTPDIAEIATLEYGTLHLKVPLIVIMGHSKCGAITAACENSELEGSLPDLIGLLKPAVARARAENPDLAGKKLIEAAAIENVRMVIEIIKKKSPALAKLSTEGKLCILGALYDIESGKVRWLDEKTPALLPGK